ncbi:tRNA-dihydrouridine(47) synthase [NAD(P)(+)]-like [Morella rubra]|uniref:tRNA-dihydrouridine(47) synthase [NAD(P)(+)] n=1 Tax=Morella rubra TaxID=262757 RepID=A0A6A1V435_9ROSI|nr:tRNA-dihydrouridine(47) synthase [NAD(P)(+)]-like [Morella rubra]
MDESPAGVVEDPKPSEYLQVPSKPNGSQQTPEELVAKAIAPVKKEFLRYPPPRTCSSTNHENHTVSETKVVALKEKKSKRQLKRERRQEQKSARNICPLIAKSGDVSSCPYNERCRFSHDLEAFKDQKPADLEGECPFMNAKEPCPYGLACRFSSTHKDGIPAGTSDARKKNSEVNGLNKDVQKLLWKNKMSFPKADAKLKALGLVVWTVSVFLALTIHLSVIILVHTPLSVFSSAF